MARSAHRLVALLAFAALGGGAGLAAGGLAQAQPRPKERKAKARSRTARAVKVGAGRGWVPPAVLAAVRAPLTGVGGSGAGTGATGPSGGPGAPATTDPGTGAGTPATTTPTTTTPPSLQAVGVTLDDRGAYTARLSRTTVAAGAVVMQLINQGEDDHNLRVVPTDHDGATVDFALTGSGQNTTQTLTLTPGSYYLFCTLTSPKNHAAAGMNATLTVTAGS